MSEMKPGQGGGGAMRRLGEALRDVAYGLAIVYLLGLAALAFRLVLVRPRPRELDLGWLAEPAGVVAVYLAGAIALLLALYFVLRLWDLLAQRRRFLHAGGEGPIEVSPFAVRDFIRTVLAQEEPRLRARVRLHRDAEGGLRVALSAALPADVPVVETAARLQGLLKERIERRLGVSVTEVSFYAQSIGAPTPRAESLPPGPSSVEEEIH